MRDPFFINPPPRLVELAQPWCRWLNLPTLPLHIHEVLFAAIFYSIMFYPVSPIVSRFLVPKHYTQLSRRRRLNWDAHIVSMIQSVLINGLAIWIIFTDDERASMSWEERVWGYTGAMSMIQALAAGYFVWDLIVTSMNLDIFGLGTLAHAVAALLVYSFGFRPFVNYYGCVFILWELSTPFLNIHWFMDKLGMTGTRAQLYNGIVLLLTFFLCRLVYGTYQSVKVFKDIWTAIDGHPPIGSLENKTMSFAREVSTVPSWLGAVYLASNLTLNGLNIYWFFMMIKAVRKRFEPEKKPQIHLDADVSSAASAVETGPAKTLRHRA